MPGLGTIINVALLIAGGLLRDKADVMAAMRAGASAVSTSAPKLWDI